MREPHLELYVHLIWTTWDRQPVLTPELLARAFACMHRDCAAMKVEMIAAGGTADHVHVLVRIPATVSVAQIAKQLKGSSSHLLNHECGLCGFRWQGAYAAFSVSRSLGRTVREYILTQQKRHSNGELERAMEVAWAESAPPPHAPQSAEADFAHLQPRFQPPGKCDRREAKGS